MAPEGFCTFEYDAKTAAWAKAALFRRVFSSGASEGVSA
ncbi:hypothetical protein Z948_472 [Sulfitobacter donghicola DSW-25 = KCTC 12864 = JCM 14565]|uniref:Uncharacterized protein n=1 Tax=Sulfitobacter donghicola DSW-25 = KCTC 12864 = JCM 14565 TaxID=1300350 RepID=A0A073ILD9_9RHOB|nr:hypothetical protein DSW25_07715 [Sulfitobacter donghicola DSW-25 = KCTC 12864 = JCM 14565]KIN66769.1 hypothetical protein Z948_472 [Sulfitobacter donghicola DSW-25 = KCTC 12864 = JCM 14565]